MTATSLPPRTRSSTRSGRQQQQLAADQRRSADGTALEDDEYDPSQSSRTSSAAPSDSRSEQTMGEPLDGSAAGPTVVRPPRSTRRTAAGRTAASSSSSQAVAGSVRSQRSTRSSLSQSSPETGIASGSSKAMDRNDSSLGMMDLDLQEPSEEHELFVRCHATNQKPSFVFVCLGVGGGPLENDCSCYLMKPADRHWRDGSYVIEGGSWLGALQKVCEDPLPYADVKFSAFHDFDFTHAHPSLRAGEIGSCAKAFLISHAHLDHILGMVLGSASLPGKRQVYGLKATLDNLLGIFDGKLWPKLASFREDAPFIVYHLKPIETLQPLHLDDSLSVLPFALSHGLNTTTVPAPPTPTQYVPPSSAGSSSSHGSGFFPKRFSLPMNNSLLPSSRVSGGSGDSNSSATSSGFFACGAAARPSFSSPFAPDPAQATHSSAFATDGVPPHSHLSTVTSSGSSSEINSSAAASEDGVEEMATPPDEVEKPSLTSRSAGGDTFSKRRRPKTAQANIERSAQGSFAGGALAPSGKAPGSNTNTAPPPTMGRGSSLFGRKTAAPRRVSIDRPPPTMDSTAFFVTHKQTGMDVLFFGDVEPDCVSRSPRNRPVWSYAACRFAQGKLNTVFLECSYPAAQPTEFLWGHLSTHYLYDELVVMAQFVQQQNRAESAAVEPGYVLSSGGPVGNAELQGILKGLTVVIVHVKQALFPSFASSSQLEEQGLPPDAHVLDPRTMQERVLQELDERDAEVGLGVRFIISKQGMRIEM